MISHIKKLKLLLGEKIFKSLIVLLLLLLISPILEVISIGLIPLLSLILVDKEKFITIPFVNYFISNYLFRYTELQIIVFFVLFIALIFFIKNIYLAFLMYYQNFLIKKIKTHLSYNIFKNYISRDYDFFCYSSPSIFIRNILNDVGNTSIYILHFINLIKEYFLIFSIFFFLLYVGGLETVLILVTLLCLVFIYFNITKKSLAKRGSLIRQFSAQIIKVVNQTIGSIKDIKLYRVEKVIKEKFFKLINLNEKLALTNTLIAGLPRLVFEIVIVYLILGIIVLFIITNKNIAEIIAYITLLTLCALRFLPSFSIIGTSLTNLKVLKSAFDNTFKELNSFQVIEKNDNYENKKKSFYQTQKKLNFSKNINIKNIDFFYLSNRKKILDNFSLKINKGDKVGIVGESGIGKSTLVDIITGFLKPTAGQVCIDGVNLQDIKYLWQKSIGYISQEIYLLEDTIKNNIAFGIEDKNIDEKLIIKALKSAQLFNFVNSLPKKLETLVGDRGKNLSVGQKQRLGIARALYFSPDTIILDESTSAMDLKTESRFLSNLFNQNKNTTIIMISHKTTSLKLCDKIFDLNKNKFIKLN